MPKQLRLFDLPLTKLTHGGSRRSGKRKGPRPLFKKRAIHLVMKARGAYGSKSMWNTKFRRRIENLIRGKARENSICILDAVNMGDHIHLKLRMANRKSFQRFLRTITGLIARLILNAEKGRPHPGVDCIAHSCEKGGHFWDSLAYTRVLKTSFEELHLKGYFNANRIEREKGLFARKVMWRNFSTWIYKVKTRSSRTQRDQGP